MPKDPYGDWQTPLWFAEEIVSLWKGPTPATVIDPTCGVGSFLKASEKAFPSADLWGWDISHFHIKEAKGHLPKARLTQSDFFDLDWADILTNLPRPILILGNPPWVTSADLNRQNAPPKTSFQGLRAILGTSNFDISENMILRLLRESPEGTMIWMLVKDTVAWKIIPQAEGWGGQVRAFSAKRVFGANVGAVLLCMKSGDAGWVKSASWEEPKDPVVLHEGSTIHNPIAFESTKHLEGKCRRTWRSGVKHDCKDVMVVPWDADLEPDYALPLMRGSCVYHGRNPSQRVIITQRNLGEPTESIRERAPKTWNYLIQHEEKLAARRSKIYHGKPKFSIFGVGPYTFSEWKVAVAALYPFPTFRAVGPHGDSPVVFDDTCYFVPCENQGEAEALVDFLHSKEAQTFIRARMGIGKRPLTQGILQRLRIPDP